MGHDEARIAMSYFDQLTVRSRHAEVAPESTRHWDLSIIYERGSIRWMRWMTVSSISSSKILSINPLRSKVTCISVCTYNSNHERLDTSTPFPSRPRTSHRKKDQKIFTMINSGLRNRWDSRPEGSESDPAVQITGLNCNFCKVVDQDQAEIHLASLSRVKYFLDQSERFSPTRRTPPTPIIFDTL